MKVRARRRPSPDREARRQKIISVAVKLFAEQGLENVTYGHIARAAKLSRPLVYFYFPDLETLFLEAALVASESLYARFVASARPGSTGQEQIMAMGLAYVAFAREEPALFRLLAHNESKQTKAQSGHPQQGRCDESAAAILDLLVACLVRGRKDGSIRSDLGNPEKVAFALWSMTHGLIQLAATKQPTIDTKLGAPFPDLPEFGLELLSRCVRTTRPTKS